MALLMKRYSFSQILSLSLLCSMIGTGPSFVLAQNNPNSNDWKDFGVISQKFMEGCVGTAKLPDNKAKIQENFCRCSLTAYQGRYTPQIFSRINALSGQLGKNGPQLVSLMMEPELSQCAKKTGFSRS